MHAMVALQAMAGHACMVDMICVDAMHGHGRPSMHAGHDRPWLAHPWQATVGWLAMAHHDQPWQCRPCTASHGLPWLSIVRHESMVSLGMAGHAVPTMARQTWPMHHAWPAMASMCGERSCRHVHSLQAVNFFTTICAFVSRATRFWSTLICMHWDTFRMRYVNFEPIQIIS